VGKADYEKERGRRGRPLADHKDMGYSMLLQMIVVLGRRVRSQKESGHNLLHVPPHLIFPVCGLKKWRRRLFRKNKRKKEEEKKNVRKPLKIKVHISPSLPLPLSPSTLCCPSSRGQGCERRSMAYKILSKRTSQNSILTQFSNVSLSTSSIYFHPAPPMSN